MERIRTQAKDMFPTVSLYALDGLPVWLKGSEYLWKFGLLRRDTRTD
ncbi:MAG: hypothetical protein V3T14_08195 [Myxococcota bacterium]